MSTPGPLRATSPQRSAPAKAFELNPWHWIGVGGFLLYARLWLDWLITGNRNLGPIQLVPGKESDVSYVAEAFAAAVFGAIIVAVLWETGFWRRWIFWRAQPSASAAGVVLGALFAFAALTELFSAVTTLLVAQETVRTADTVVPLTDLYERTEAQYAWHFADAIPALDVPETLKWKVPYEFANAAGGSLVLVYKILVILPIIGLAVDLTARVRDQGTPRATR